MEKEQNLLKNLHNLEHQYYVTKICLKLYHFDKASLITYLDSLINKTNELMDRYTINPSSSIYNNIDNNLFDLESYLTELKIELDGQTNIKPYVFLTNKATSELKEIDASINNVLTNASSIENAIKQVEQFARNIMHNYVLCVEKYLNDNQDYQALRLFNKDGINQILNKELILENDWNYIYKQMNLVIKSIEKKSIGFVDLLNEKYSFELAYLLMLVEA